MPRKLALTCADCGEILSADHAHDARWPCRHAHMARASAIRIANRIQNAHRFMCEQDRDMTKACGTDRLGVLVRQLLTVAPMWAREWAHDTLREQQDRHE
jgi:hypothetical protein